MNFLEYQPQSDILQQTEIQLPEPLSLENCTNPVIVKDYINTALEYRIEVGCKRLRDEASVDDLKNADRGVILAYIAEVLPAIKQAVKASDVVQITNSVMEAVDAQFDERFAQISTQITAQISARLDHIDARLARSEVHNENTLRTFFNKWATRDYDPIQPILKLPTVPPFIAGQSYPKPVEPEPLPADFPATKGEMWGLAAPLIETFLNYYEIPFEGDPTTTTRHALLATYLGVPHSYY